MRILLLADRAPRERLKSIIEKNSGIDLIITLWDLYYYDLEDLKYFPDIPKIWVYWNHCDWIYMPELWITNLHLKKFELWWVSFWGFEWCNKYKEGKFQYSQDHAKEMIRLLPEVNVLICHCPPFGINDDQDDLAHIGFKALRDYIDKYKPEYLFHGHTYDKNNSFIDEFNWTKIIYVYQEKIVDIF